MEVRRGRNLRKIVGRQPKFEIGVGRGAAVPSQNPITLQFTKGPKR